MNPLVWIAFWWLVLVAMSAVAWIRHHRSRRAAGRPQRPSDPRSALPEQIHTPAWRSKWARVGPELEAAAVSRPSDGKPSPQPRPRLRPAAWDAVDEQLLSNPREES